MIVPNPRPDPKQPPLTRDGACMYVVCMYACVFVVGAKHDVHVACAYDTSYDTAAELLYNQPFMHTKIKSGRLERPNASDLQEPRVRHCRRHPAGPDRVLPSVGGSGANRGERGSRGAHPQDRTSTARD